MTEVRISPSVSVPMALVRLTYARAGGPGGQHVNKTETAAELAVTVRDLTMLPPDARTRLRDLAGSRLTNEDELRLRGDRTRSQEMNRRDVIERFAELCRKSLVRPKPRKKTKPSRAAKEKRLQRKKQRGELKRQRGDRPG